MDPLVIDIREKWQFDGGHIEGAINCSAESVIDSIKGVNRSILVYCDIGRESSQIVADLLANGHDAYSLKGVGMPLRADRGFHYFCDIVACTCSSRKRTNESADTRLYQSRRSCRKFGNYVSAPARGTCYENGTAVAVYCSIFATMFRFRDLCEIIALKESLTLKL